MTQKLEHLYFSLFGIRQQIAKNESGMIRALFHNEGNSALFFRTEIERLQAQEADIQRDIELTLKKI